MILAMNDREVLNTIIAKTRQLYFKYWSSWIKKQAIDKLKAKKILPKLRIVFSLLVLKSTI